MLHGHRASAETKRTNEFMQFSVSFGSAQSLTIYRHICEYALQARLATMGLSGGFSNVRPCRTSLSSFLLLSIAVFAGRVAATGRQPIHDNQPEGETPPAQQTATGAASYSME
jgi:hypothetical protein